ncbi:MAG: hypothetical protein KDN18_10345 [Verrucomicrobiae bacterium]|nr:hypothetical protein [Verrucomicrobiae bacterium]
MKAEEPVPALVAVPEPATPVRQAPEPEVTLPVPAPAQAIEETSPVSEPVPVVQPQSQPEPVTESGEGTDLRDLEFRAIFSTSETFTLSMLARKIVSLPGIASCSLSTPGKLVQASRREENRLGNQAREMVETLRSLAKLTGLPEAKTFTLQTDRGIVSLFLEGDHCVCVNQEGPAFEAGVREKLILIARCIHRLRD